MQLQLGRKTLFTQGLHIRKSLWSTWWAKYIRQPLALTLRMTLSASAEFCIWLITPLSLLGADYSRNLPLLLKPTIAVVKFLLCISREWGRITYFSTSAPDNSDPTGPAPNIWEALSWVLNPTWGMEPVRGRMAMVLGSELDHPWPTSTATRIQNADDWSQQNGL